MHIADGAAVAVELASEIHGYPLLIIRNRNIGNQFTVGCAISVINPVCKPVQVTGIADFVNTFRILNRGFVSIADGAEAVGGFGEVVGSIHIHVGIRDTATAAHLIHRVILQHGVFIDAQALAPDLFALIALEEVSNFAGSELGCGSCFRRTGNVAASDTTGCCGIQIIAVADNICGFTFDDNTTDHAAATADSTQVVAVFNDVYNTRIVNIGGIIISCYYSGCSSR